MPEYIKREAAIRALCEAVHDKDGDVPCRNQIVSCQHSGTRTQEYAEKILAIPAADVVPVVRCKDCRKGIPDSEHATAYSCYGIWHKPDWFCAGGVRRDGDGE